MSSSADGVTSSPLTVSPLAVAPLCHSMVTHALDGIHKPNPWYAIMIAATTVSLVFTSAHVALHDPNWKARTQREFNALQANHTWRLILRPSCTNVIIGKWVFKHNYNPNGSFDFRDTFTLVVKPMMIRIVLTHVAGKWWPV